MQVKRRTTSLHWIIAAVMAAAVPALNSAAHAQQPTNTIPVSEQNALVQQYCAVCHDDAHKNGGLSLQHFDASAVEPSLAAMMLSKLDTGAIGAAGIPGPDKTTELAFYNSLSEKASGANQWTVKRTEDPVTRERLVTASIIRETPARGDRSRELYRVKLTCRPDTREAEMQLTWSPMSAQGRRNFMVSMDGHDPITFSLEGRETMGNGAKTADGKDSVSGSASAVLYATASIAGSPTVGARLPANSMTISNVFPDETVVFPFDRLTPQMREQFSGCF
jgi:hypothetical protein